MTKTISILIIEAREELMALAMAEYAATDLLEISFSGES